MDTPDAPATRADLAQARDELKTDVAQLRNELKTDVAHLRDELVEHMSEIETHLLKAFYTFAESNQLRLKDAENNEAALRRRVGVIEDRLFEVEKRLNMPPAS